MKDFAVQNKNYCIYKAGKELLYDVAEFVVNENYRYLFRQLMMCAIYPIYQEKNGYMIAECDSKLLRIVNLSGIDTVRLGNSVYYLGSNTIPVYADK